jgi:Ca2+-binding EF-hand superfamily protein
LTAQQKESLRSAFLLLDHDRSGTIETGELGIVMNALGMEMTQDKLVEIAAEMDADGSGEVRIDGGLHDFALPWS